MIPLVLCALPVGLAFWFTYPSRSAAPKPWNLAVASIVAIDGLLLGLLLADLAFTSDASLASGRPAVLLGGVAVLTVSLCWYAADLWADAAAAKSHGPETPLEASEAISRQRVRTTRQLTTWLQVTLIMLGLGVVETLGRRSISRRKAASTAWPCGARRVWLPRWRG